MTTAVLEQAIAIAELNDRLRRGDHRLGKWVTSEIVSNSSSEEQQELFRLVRTFNNFTPENDPYRERDFGSVEMNEEKYLWKIDYYDLSYDYGSEDPSDSAQTRRVLTIMHSSEY
jgi:hypothetical protein